MDENNKVEIVDIATQTAQAFKLPDGNTVDINSYLVWIGNQIIELKKAVIG